MAIIYLLLFISPQILLYLYLRARLPDPTRPSRARLERYGLAFTFVLFNLPWLVVLRRVLMGSVWGIGRVPYLAPWIAWQLLSWVLCACIAVYVIGKSVVWVMGRAASVVRKQPRDGGGGGAGKRGSHGPSERHHVLLPPSPSANLSRRRFLATATYAYAASGMGLTAYGIWDAERLPDVTHRTLYLPGLPRAFNGLRVLHLSDVHAGIHMERDKMQEIVALANAQQPDLILQTGDMIDISPSYVPEYVRAFRDLTAPLGIVTCLGNHDRYTGETIVVKGVRDAGQIFIKNDAHLIERDGAALAILGIDDPRSWTTDQPQDGDIDLALRSAPKDAYRILLAHRPGAFDGAAPRGIPLTLAGHIHGGQIYVPILGWSAGSLITKYVMGHFQQGGSQLYVSRGIGVVGVPIRLFVPPEIAVLELRTDSGPSGN